MRKLLCKHKISAKNYVIVFYLFFPFVWAKSLFIYERERGLSYTSYNFCEHKKVVPMLYFPGPLRGDNGHAWPRQPKAKEFKANPIGVLLWG